MFTSASVLVDGDTNGNWDVFAYRMATGALIPLSVGTSGSFVAGASGLYGVVSVSGDGSYAAYHSYASLLVPGDTNAIRDIFRASIP